MNNVYFAIAVHFHQPIGNFEHIFERAHNLCYRPFVKLLSNYPDIKMAFHISGCLSDYLERHHGKTIELVKKMVCRGQIEMMTGGYYEPILTAVPERDLMGQISMMMEYIKQRFNFAPDGMWVPERVWEPHLAKIIYKAGIRYAVLDDTHFFRSGVKKEDIHNYFLTGPGKEKIAVFPSDKTLRYAIPFKLPNETIDYFRKVAEEREAALFTYGDDGEKFGEWPGTYQWVFKEKWLEKFFNALRDNSSWIKLVHFSDYLKNNKPLYSLNIKQGSYEEMMEWSDGNWSNFISKYPEANQMHKRMFYISSKIDRIEKQLKRQDIRRIQKARRELYQGQCNCAYWHGVFGGLYLYHLRSAVYNHLITADKIADDILHKDKRNWIDIKEVDLYQNGKKGIFIANKTFSIFIDQHGGAVIKELDYRPLACNLINTLSRKKEWYHQKILNSIHRKDQGKVCTIHDDFRTVNRGLKEKLIYDKFTRYFLRDHFIKKDLKMENFINSSYKELADFVDKPYLAKIKDKGVIFKRTAKLLKAQLELSKQIMVKSSKEIEFFYTIRKKGFDRINDVNFGIEFNITMPYLNADRYNYSYDNKNIAGLNEKGSIADIFSFGISDSNKELDIKFRLSRKSLSLWYFPVETISQSERAYELNYQCSCIFPLWNLDFNKQNIFDLTIKLILG